MKKIIKPFASMLFILFFGINDGANAMCGFGWISLTQPTPTCSCPSNRVAIKQMTNNICQEEKCVTSGAATHYLNQEWIYGCCAVARLDEGETAEISVYPNPAVTQLSVIGYLFSENSAVEIYDVHGKRIFSQQVKVNTRQPLTIDVSAWMQGMYFVTVTAGNNVFTEKILVK